MGASVSPDSDDVPSLLSYFNNTSRIPFLWSFPRYSIFDVNDATRKTEFYWLASQGVPIRVRQNPTTYPELAHWKATIFAGQNIVSFGSANYTPLELGPQPGAHSDQTVMFTDDPALVNSSPEDEGWFFKLTIADKSELEGLMDAAAYKSFCDSL